jgi:hypothetical protein
MQCEYRWVQKKRRAGCRPSSRTRWFVMQREANEESGGLGSSHTAPCGAAVPARPPTRSSETTHLHCTSQWVRRATRQGTRVVVQTSLFSNSAKRTTRAKSFHCYGMHEGQPADSCHAIPNSTTSLPPPFQLLSRIDLTRRLRVIVEQLRCIPRIHQRIPRSFLFISLDRLLLLCYPS